MEPQRYAFGATSECFPAFVAFISKMNEFQIEENV